MTDPQLLSGHDSERDSEHDFWMGVRQHLFGLVALIERRLGRHPTTKQRLDWYKEQHIYDATHTDYPDYEVTET